MRKFFRRYRNSVIKFHAWINLIVCMLSACCLDSEGYTAQIVFAVTLLWLAVFAYANGYMEVVNGTLQYDSKTGVEHENDYLTDCSTGTGSFVSSHGRRRKRKI